MFLALLVVGLLSWGPTAPHASASVEQMDPDDLLNVYVEAQGGGIVSWHISAVGWGSAELCHQRYHSGIQTHSGCYNFSGSTSPSGTFYCNDGDGLQVDAQIYIGGSFQDAASDFAFCEGDYTLPCATTPAYHRNSLQENFSVAAAC